MDQADVNEQVSDGEAFDPAQMEREKHYEVRRGYSIKTKLKSMVVPLLVLINS